MRVRISLRTTVVHNTAQNSSDNVLHYPSDNHHSKKNQLETATLQTLPTTDGHIIYSVTHTTNTNVTMSAPNKNNDSLQ